MAAAKFKPPRLVALVDYKQVQLDGPATSSCPWTSAEKLRAFNWNVAPVVYDATTPPRCWSPWIGPSAKLKFPRR